MRKLQYHEQKLLKKVNLTKWKSTNTEKEQLVTTKFILHDRKDYVKYNRIVGLIRKLADSLSGLEKDDEFRKYISNKSLDFLYDTGLIKKKHLTACKEISVSAFCKRRLPMILKAIRLVPNYTDADKFVRQGHIQVGIKVHKDPSLLIPRRLERFIGWKEDSKIKKKIDQYNKEYDDYKY